MQRATVTKTALCGKARTRRHDWVQPLPVPTRFNASTNMSKISRQFTRELKIVKFATTAVFWGEDGELMMEKIKNHG
jgi:hypothetical protein